MGVGEGGGWASQENCSQRQRPAPKPQWTFLGGGVGPSLLRTPPPLAPGRHYRSVFPSSHLPQWVVAPLVPFLFSRLLPSLPRVSPSLALYFFSPNSQRRLPGAGEALPSYFPVQSTIPLTTPAGSRDSSKKAFPAQPLSTEGLGYWHVGRRPVSPSVNCNDSPSFGKPDTPRPKAEVGASASQPQETYRAKPSPKSWGKVGGGGAMARSEQTVYKMRGGPLLPDSPSLICSVSHPPSREGWTLGQKRPQPPTPP